MELILILLILAVFLFPSLLLMRTQKKRQQQVAEMQASIQPGDRIVNVAGFHGTVVENNGEMLRVELAPGTVVAMETAGVMKKVEDTPAVPQNYDEVPGSAGQEWSGEGGTAADDYRPGGSNRI